MAIESGNYGDLEYGEIAHIIQLSARLKSVSEIIQAMRTFSPGKTITGTQVMAIQADNATRIAREASIYCKYVEGSPLSHDRLVYDMWMELVNDCKTPRAIGAPDPTTGVRESIPDNNNAIKALNCALNFRLALEKINLEKLKYGNQSMPAVNKNQEGENSQSTVDQAWTIL